MAGSPTSISLTQPPKYPAAGSMKITDQVIEEVDEQMTITSMRAPEQRPTAQSLFMPPTGPPPPSHPVMVPTTNRAAVGAYTRTQSAVANADAPFTYPIVGDAEAGFISTSAPPGTHIQTTPVGIYDIEIEDFDQAAPIEGSVTTGKLDSIYIGNSFVKKHTHTSLQNTINQSTRRMNSKSCDWHAKENESNGKSLKSSDRLVTIRIWRMQQICCWNN